RLEAFAFNQFHRDEKESCFFARVINDHDVGMSQQPGGARLGLEAVEKFFFAEAGTLFRYGERFYGHRAAYEWIVRAIDHTHGAAADFAGDFIAARFA